MTTPITKTKSFLDSKVHKDPSVIDRWLASLRKPGRSTVFIEGFVASGGFVIITVSFLQSGADT